MKKLLLVVALLASTQAFTAVDKKLIGGDPAVVGGGARIIGGSKKVSGTIQVGTQSPLQFTNESPNFKIEEKSGAFMTQDGIVLGKTPSGSSVVLTFAK